MSSFRVQSWEYDALKVEVSTTFHYRNEFTFQ